MTIKTYRVRNLPLHREIYTQTARGRQKSFKVYQPSEQIELALEEAALYQHLLETEEQYQSRTNAKVTPEGAKK